VAATFEFVGTVFTGVPETATLAACAIAGFTEAAAAGFVAAAGFAGAT
jgi:hypothetical protein